MNIYFSKSLVMEEIKKRKMEKMFSGIDYHYSVCVFYMSVRIIDYRLLVRCCFNLISTTAMQINNRVFG